MIALFIKEHYLPGVKIIEILDCDKVTLSKAVATLFGLAAQQNRDDRQKVSVLWSSNNLASFNLDESFPFLHIRQEE